MIRIGTIGSGKIAEHFLDAVEHCEGVEYGIAYSRTRERAEEFAGKRGAKGFCWDLKELVRSDLADCIYIASPNCCHFEQAKLALEAGKHVIVEKPAVSNRREWKILEQTAREHERFLMEAVRHVYDPAMEAVRRGLEQIGRVRRASLRFCQYSSRYDNFRRGIVENAFKPELSNGALMDIGVYCVRMMTELFGLPEQVMAHGIFLENGVDGAGTILGIYPGMDAELSYSKITDGRLGCEIQGEDGTLVFDGVSRPGRVRLIRRDGREEILFEEDESWNLEYEIRKFVSWMESGDCEATDYLRALQMSDAEMKVLDEARKQMGIVFPADRKPLFE
ncbi:MAG TPA: Gfo/Idh/MocA family oxidoreductase [Candidatus Lachnoclostridium pullistercoris]|uniref:Gfo/Idh/MocA family oxidoreductase n=1 Tax=Candidatus Lachnoclostridium pullistercoris TaxID=2838632 RepID=A0A9D2PDY4_9FIRM|nr:Gfo/Idh/MocA family oxidoreductase [Candidatus Lachnoclostridium pullistercoris]